MKADEIFGMQCRHGVRVAVIIGEFDLECVGREHFHNGSHLPAHKTMIREIVKQRHFRQEFEILHKEASSKAQSR